MKEHVNVVEGIYSTGAITKKWDARDHKYERVAKGLGYASIPFDWSAGFDVIDLLKKKINNPNFDIVTENQGQSGSCGGQALRYYLEALKCLKTGEFDRLSAKDPYCRIFYIGGGTDIRSIGNVAVQKDKGVKQEAVVPSYQNGSPPSELFMEDRTVSNATPNAPRFTEFAYAFQKTDIESIAQAIRDNNGCIIQVDGSNNGTWRSQFPQPPQKPEWSHFLFAVGSKIIDGKKYIKVKNSWGDFVDGGYQYLSEDYFKGSVTACIVLYDSNLYNYTPPPTQIALTWLQKFLQFFYAYSIKPYSFN